METTNEFTLVTGADRLTPSSYANVVDYFSFLMIRDYLYKLYKKEIYDESLVAEKMLGVKNNADHFIKSISPEFENAGIASFKEQFIYFFVNYNGCEYIISFVINIEVRIDELVLYIVGIEGINGKSSYQLFSELKKAAIKNSSLKNQIIEIKDSKFTSDLLNNIEVHPAPDIKLDHLFISKKVIAHIERLIFELNNYKFGKKTFKYLFNGKPGTGKTQLISAIVSAVYGKITTVVVKGTEYKFKDIFDFCSIFSPSLLVIDDLDFIAEERKTSNSNRNLIDLLHALDGMYSSPIFFLAATNDKNLVDSAASRPGRFDMIFDFTSIEKANYMSLIKRETVEPQIIEMFDENVLRFFEEKNVSVAFIVNLIKQLISMKEVNEEFGQQDLFELLSLTYDGFYDFNDKALKKVIGF